jgi:uncharacterized protein
VDHPNQNTVPTASTKSQIITAMPYVLPFALFALCTYLPALLSIPLAVAYPAKTILVAATLAWFWRSFGSEIRLQMDLPAVAAGIVVFLIWVGLEGLYPQIGTAGAHAANQVEVYGVIWFLAFRLIGAALVVPVMEELFWRSFAMRFLIDFDFRKVPLGQFTWFSFIAVSVAFGFEHHQWLPGIIAGVVYAAVLYRSKNLFSPILAHGVTNLLLGIYVMQTGRWEFW